MVGVIRLGGIPNHFASGAIIPPYLWYPVWCQNYAFLTGDQGLGMEEEEKRSSYLYVIEGLCHWGLIHYIKGENVDVGGQMAFLWLSQ